METGSQLAIPGPLLKLARIKASDAAMDWAFSQDWVPFDAYLIDLNANLGNVWGQRPALIVPDPLWPGAPAEPLWFQVSPQFDSFNPNTKVNLSGTDTITPPDPLPLPPRINPGYTPTDPLFSQQWHLFDAFGVDVDINVTEVWPEYTGRGVHVGIFDTAVQSDHHDLDGNYDHSREFVYDLAVIDGLPTGEGQNHGTMVAGVIAAENDGVGTVGVAFGAHITAVPIIEGPGHGHLLLTHASVTVPLDRDYLRAALNYQAEFDVVNRSNPTPGFDEPNEDAPGRASLRHAAEDGRDGLGTVVVASGGNDRHIVTVAAVGPDGFAADYSTPRTYLLVSAPSAAAEIDGRIGAVGIATTDRPGDAGVVGRDLPGSADNAHRVPGDSTGDYALFGGPSAATAIVTGVVALMLDANPNLGWRDVKEILAYSAHHIGAGIGAARGVREHDDWHINHARDWNGGGLHFSRDYGFGLVDAHAAVRLAETWASQSTSDNEQNPSASVTAPHVIPDGGNFVTRFTIDGGVSVETIELTLQLTHPHAGDLVFELRSPSGTISTLLSHADFDADHLRFTSNQFWGESSGGTWTLTVRDTVRGNAGSLGERALTIHGAAADTANTYIYTDEFGSLPGIADDPARDRLVDTNGGVDTVNASAVTTDMQLDLFGGRSTIAGRAVILSGIENAIGGDGGDTITGTNRPNVLRGMRGDDQIDGKGDNDTVDGGAGDDTLNGGAGNDILIGGPGHDIFVFDTFLNARTNVDRVMDFDPAADVIHVDNLFFTALGSPGLLNAEFFYVGAAAHDFNDHIIYNSETGALLYDPDGIGLRAPTQFATLDPHLGLSYKDFVVI